MPKMEWRTLTFGFLLMLSMLVTFPVSSSTILDSSVQIEFNSVYDLTDGGFNYYGASSHVEVRDCIGSTGSSCIVDSFLLNEANGTVQIDLYFTSLGGLDAIYIDWFNGTYTVTVAFSYPIPLKLGDLYGSENSQYAAYNITRYVLTSSGNYSQASMIALINITGPTNYYGYNVYKISVVEENDTYQWTNPLIDLYYSSQYHAILGVKIYGLVSIASPTIKGISPPPTSTTSAYTPPQSTPQPTGGHGGYNTSPPSGLFTGTQSANTGLGNMSEFKSGLGASAYAVIGLLVAIGLGILLFMIIRKKSGPQVSSHQVKMPPPPPPVQFRTEKRVTLPKVKPLTKLLSIMVGGRKEVQVAYDCPQGCNINVDVPVESGVRVAPSKLSLKGKGTATLTLYATRTASPGSIPVELRVEPGGEIQQILVDVITPKTVMSGEATNIAGLSVPDYEIIKPLGSGGFSTVYLAKRVADGKLVALKVPKFELGATVGGNLAEQFKKEAETWSRLDHPNVVKVLDYGVKPVPYIAMEYMEKGSLRDLLEKKGALDQNRAIRIALDVGEALSYAHHMGVIHRDLKPENILFNGKDRAKITDFGLAKVLLQASMSSASGFKGTLLYAAPEQVDSSTFGAPDWRTDIWQYGALLYEMLTGRPPFMADNPLALIRKIVSEDPPPPSYYNPEIPDWLDDLVMKCLEKRKEDRWKSIELLLERMYDKIGK